MTVGVVALPLALTFGITTGLGAQAGPVTAIVPGLPASRAAGPTSRFRADRELFGQGLANIVSPLFGGMTATGAIARTAVNVRAGARTRVASIGHERSRTAATCRRGERGRPVRRSR